MYHKYMICIIYLWCRFDDTDSDWSFLHSRCGDKPLGIIMQSPILVSVQQSNSSGKVVNVIVHNTVYRWCFAPVYGTVYIRRANLLTSAALIGRKGAAVP